MELEKKKTGNALPNQRVSSKRKMQKDWQESSMKFFIDSAYYSHKNKRKSVEEMNRNWAIVDSSIDGEELSDTFDPLGLRDDPEFANAPIDLQFYNVVSGPLDTLIGEDLKRKNDIRAIAINPTVLNQKDMAFKEKLYGYLEELSNSSKELDQQLIQDKLGEIDKWKKHDLQTAHEMMANQILQMITNDSRIDLKSKMSNALKSLLINAECTYRVGNIGKELQVYNVESRNFKVIGLNKTNKIEDGYAWVEREYMNPHKILEEFGRSLTNIELDKLLSLYNTELGIYPKYEMIPTSISNGIIEPTLDDGALFSSGKEMYMNDSNWDASDSEGNILVTRVFWLSLRKLGELTYLDEDGTSQYKFVDENYVVKEELGESVEWFYVNEVWQGVKLAEDIYVDVKPCDVQMRSLINPIMVRPPYVGIINNESGNNAKSILDDLIPYQKDFAIWMNKLKILWVQNIGKVANIDVSMIPEDMTMDEWFNWMKTYKINFMNKFNESNKGQLAGNMQQGGKDIDLDVSREISEAINMLEWLKTQIDERSGVSRQRQGDIGVREGLGTSQQAVIQSSHRTEKYFYLHDTVKIRLYEVIVEYIKVLWKDEKGKRQYMLDDISNHLIDINGELLNEAEFGIQMTNGSRLYEMEQTLRQLTHAAMQNGTATLSDIAKMQMATSPSEMVISLSAAEEKRLKQQQEQQKIQLEGQQKQQEMLMQLEERKHQMKLEMMDREWMYRLQDAQIKQDYEAQQRSEDSNYNWINDEVENDMNIRDNETKIKDITSREKMKDKELKLKEKIELLKIESQKKLAAMKKV